MFRTAILAALIALPAIASAQQQAETGQPPKRIRRVTLTGDQKCPPGTGDEIVVCSRNDEPYRIPKELRNDGPIAAQNQSWVNRTATMDEVGRTAGGLPDTCSPVGTGGQSGCALARNKAYAAERREQASGQNATP